MYCRFSLLYLLAIFFVLINYLEAKLLFSLAVAWLFLLNPLFSLNPFFKAGNLNKTLMVTCKATFVVICGE